MRPALFTLVAGRDLHCSDSPITRSLDIAQVSRARLLELTGLELLYNRRKANWARADAAVRATFDDAKDRTGKRRAHAVSSQRE